MCFIRIILDLQKVFQVFLNFRTRKGICKETAPCGKLSKYFPLDSNKKHTVGSKMHNNGTIRFFIAAGKKPVKILLTVKSKICCYMTGENPVS